MLEPDELPLLLPEVDNYKPAGTGERPLAAIPDWVETTDPVSGRPARRETNTMPQWAGSCWYYLRFIDPRNARTAWDPAKERYWMPVDLYVGGAEHAVLHLLYARFWHKVLFDLGLVSTAEPFHKLRNQGMILGENGEKMSKSRGNVVNPDDVIRDHGADALRLYLMFLGPLEATSPGTRTASRASTASSTASGACSSTRTATLPPTCRRRARRGDAAPLHTTIRKVTPVTEDLRFNTAISQMMMFVNEMNPRPAAARGPRAFVLLLAPFAPHLAEELWRAGPRRILAYEPWPPADPRYLVQDTVTVVVQVNGKLRDRLEVAADADEEEVKRWPWPARRSAVDRGQADRQGVFVPGKLVSLVVK